MDCKTCKERRGQAAETVSFISHESDMARLERANFRLWVLVVLLAVGFGIMSYLYVAQAGIQF